MIRLAVLLFSAYITYQHIGNYTLIDVLFVAIGVWVILENHRYINITSLIVIIIAMRLIEWPLLLSWAGTSRPFVFYSMLIFLDVATIVLVMLRVPILIVCESKLRGCVDEKKYCITRADFMVAIIYSVYLMINILLFVEHWIRHVDDIPGSKIVFEQIVSLQAISNHYSAYNIHSFQDFTQYFYENARHIYATSPVIKAYLNMLEYAVVLATSYKFMHSSKLFSA